MRRLLADLEAICALYPPLSIFIQEFCLLFFKLLCTGGCSRIKTAQNPKRHLTCRSMKSIFSYVSIMHFHSYKTQLFQKYPNLISCLTTHLVLGMCSSRSPEVKRTCRHLVTGLSSHFCLQLSGKNE